MFTYMTDQRVQRQTRGLRLGPIRDSVFRIRDSGFGVCTRSVAAAVLLVGVMAVAQPAAADVVIDMPPPPSPPAPVADQPKETAAPVEETDAAGGEEENKQKAESREQAIRRIYSQDVTSTSRSDLGRIALGRFSRARQAPRPTGYGNRYFNRGYRNYYASNYWDFGWPGWVYAFPFGVHHGHFFPHGFFFHHHHKKDKFCDG